MEGAKGVFGGAGDIVNIHIIGVYTLYFRYILDFLPMLKILENFMLTYGVHLGYNLKMQGLSPKGGTFYAENLSAQEAP